ncbi:MAG: hypothetical protein COB84_07270 [Rhodobacteraceae bacterium]|nr:MAG: hypothetical protein COB84_07270 [Paracoccaceae bacterium]
MKTIPSISVILVFISLVTVSVIRPIILSQNVFLIEFVKHEYVNFLAVVVTVSILTVVQIHNEYTRIERANKLRVFEVPRQSINTSAFMLIASLVAAFVISFLVPTFSENNIATSILFSFALTSILHNIFIMYDLVQTASYIAANEPIDDD